jgi:hypothetical protein
MKTPLLTVIVCLMSVCAYGYDFSEDAGLTDRDLASEIPESPGEYVISFQNEQPVLTHDSGASNDIIKSLELALKYIDGNLSQDVDINGLLIEYDRKLKAGIQFVSDKIERLEREKKELEQKANDIEYIRETLRVITGD